MDSLLVSACLLGCPCKYSGGDNLCPEVMALKEKFHLVPLCPEQLGGLPTPRPPAERLGNRVITQEGRDVTGQYTAGAETAVRLSRLLGCVGAVLKARSPSCGAGQIYDGSFTGTLIPGDGVTVQALRAAGVPVYTEEELDKLPKL